MTEPSVPPPVPPQTDAVIDKEPVVALLTSLAGILDLGLIAANALDWIDLSDEQTAAVVAFITATTAAVGAYLRSKVWAPNTVAHLVGGPR